MKNKILIIFLGILILVGCSSNKNEEKKDSEKTKVDEVLENMTLDEKIGQMMIIYYRAASMDSTLKSALENVQPGGFILFAENMSSYDGTLKLIKEIKASSKIPMFMSIDEEGGKVQRLLKLQGKEVSNVPSMYDVGLKNDTELTYQVGKLLAEELKVFDVS